MSKNVIGHEQAGGSKVLKSWFLLFVFLQLFFSPLLVLAVEKIPSKLDSGSLLMLPYFEAFVDNTGQLSIYEIQNESVQAKFIPLNEAKLHRQQGALWLRFTLSVQNPDAKQKQSYLLDMGEDKSLNPLLFVAQADSFSQEVIWEKFLPSDGSVFLLPEMQDEPITAFIRLDGIPGIWFTPTLRTPQNAATTIELFAKPAAIVALVVVMLLCLLRGLTEKGQWRYWAGLYTAVSLFYAIYGVPSANKGSIPMENLAQIMAPGLALILWAHVGRHLLRTQDNSKALDWQYLGLTLVGIVVALLPLISNYAWTVYYLSLWPALTLCFIPSTIAAWIQGLSGAKRYLIASILPPLGLAIGLIGLFEPGSLSNEPFLPVSILATMPLWGLALGTLVLAGLANSQGLLVQDSAQKNTPLEPHMTSVESVVQSDPNLRLVPAGLAQSENTDGSEEGESEVKNSTFELEEQLRWPIEQLLRDVAALETCALSEEAYESIGSIVGTVRDIASIIDTPAKQRMGVSSMGGTQEHVFDLQSLLRQAHDTVSPVADKKNIALSWFMQPNLAPCYKGDALQLLFVLRLLLESSIRSTHRGAVQLIVRKVPESVNPGHLLFTVTDSGTGKPPHERSITALARAWELSASYHGFIGVESNALGAAISFTVHYEVCASQNARKSEQTVARDQPRPIILVSDNTEERQMWGFFLEKMPRVLEARNCEEAIEIYEKYGATLLIFDARMPLAYVQQAMNILKQSSARKDEKRPITMAIFLGAENTATLAEMGFNYLLSMPVTKPILCKHVKDILVKIEQKEKEEEEKRAELAAQQEQYDEDDYLEHDTQENDLSEEYDDDLDDTEFDQDGIHSQDANNDEVIDTGVPILEMNKKELSVDSALSEPRIDSPKLSLDSDQNTQGEHYQALSMDAYVSTKEDKDENISHAEPLSYDVPLSLEPQFSSGDKVQNSIDETFTEFDKNINSSGQESSLGQETSSKRPIPSEDKSNSAYLSAFLDDDTETATEDNIQVEKQETESKVVRVQGSILKSKGAKSEVKKVALSEKQSDHEKDVPVDVVIDEPIIEPTAEPIVDLLTETVLEQVAEPVMDSIAESIVEPTVESVIEPKIMSKTAKLSLKNLKADKKNGLKDVDLSNDTVSANEKINPVEDVPVKDIVVEQSKESNDAPQSDSQANSQIVMTKGSIKPKLKIKDNVKTESVIESKIESKLELKPESDVEFKGESKDAPNAMPQLEGKSERPVRSRTTSSETYSSISSGIFNIESDSDEWVGEPMPQTKQVSETDSSKDVTISSATNSITGQEDSSLSLSEADRRGLEELANLREYLGNNNVHEQTSSHSPFEWVGEPTPITSKAEEQNVVKEQSKASEEKAQPKVTRVTIPKKKMPKVKLAMSESPTSEVEKNMAKEDVKPNLKPRADSEKSANFAPVSTEVKAHTDKPVKHKEQASKGNLSPIEQLLVNLDENILQAKDYFDTADTHGIETAVSTMAVSAESFGLRTLARLARTVHAAAQAQDLDALSDLIPELDMSVQRNKAALRP